MSASARALAGVCTSLAVGLLVACGPSTSTAPPGPGQHSPARAAPPTAAPSRLLDSASFAAAVADPRTTTINVHIPFAGDIPGTRTSIPYDRIGTQTDRLPADRHAPLALYCRTGPMSAVAAHDLARQGYTDIVELAGGMDAWARSGRPIINRPTSSG